MDAFLYVNSSHPKSITKNIVAAVNRRLCALSSDEQKISSVAPTDQGALKNVEYTYKLKFTPTAARDTRKRSKRNLFH